MNTNVCNPEPTATEGCWKLVESWLQKNIKPEVYDNFYRQLKYESIDREKSTITLSVPTEAHVRWHTKDSPKKLSQELSQAWFSVFKTEISVSVQNRKMPSGMVPIAGDGVMIVPMANQKIAAAAKTNNISTQKEWSKRTTTKLVVPKAITKNSIQLISQQLPEGSLTKIGIQLRLALGVPGSTSHVCIHPDDILKVVAYLRNISVNDIRSRRKDSHTIRSRIISIILVDLMTKLSPQAIGKMFGNRGKASVKHAYEQAKGSPIEREVEGIKYAVLQFVASKQFDPKIFI